MRTSRSVLGLAAFAFASTSLQAQAPSEPLELVPSSSWVLNYAEESCSLRRAFAGDGHQAILEIRQYQPGDRFQVVVASRTLAQRQIAPKTRFEPDDAWFEPTPASFTKSGEGMGGVLYEDSLWPAGHKTLLEPRPGQAREADERRPTEALASIGYSDVVRDAREKAITGLLITGSFERGLSLQTGEMHNPMRAMRACLDQLLTHWGLDLAVQRTLSRRPKPINYERWVPAVHLEYPSEMVRKEESGTLKIRLIVGADGKPTSCAVQSETAHPDFNESSCRALMRSARFEPAHDAQGAPVASYFTTTIVYALQRRP